MVRKPARRRGGSLSERRVDHFQAGGINKTPSGGRRPSDVIREANRKATEGPTTEDVHQRDHDLRLRAGDALPDLHGARSSSPTSSFSPGSTSSASRRPATTSAGFSLAGARRLGGTEQQHIYIKPTRPDLETTLAINTDRRSYILELHSYDDTYMAARGLALPAGRGRAARDDARAAAGARRDDHADRNVSVDKLNFGYGVAVMSGRPQWMPTQVFDDGHKTFIRFP